ncbi:MAG: hypothetical protein H6658_05510 [Ardenticatenaceae bacterium]|nr:hypothetical protein [Ardenticatenaceae bacterium]
MKKRTTLYVLRFTILTLFWLSACSGGADEMPAGVDEVFAPHFAALGGERVLGEPISEAFPLEDEGLTVQYFQNLRLEYETGQPQSVRVSPLGEWGYEGLREVVPDEVDENGRSRTFPTTNETIYNEFLTFYETFDGEQILGWPISPQLTVGGVRTQYFENGRLEWRPQLPLEQRVQLGWLGREHFDSEMAFTYRAFENAAPVAGAGVAEVDIMASLQSPVIYTGDEQQLFVTAVTPTGAPVTDVTVTAVLYHDNTETPLSLGETDGDGRLNQPLDLQNISPGQDVAVVITVAENGRILGQTRLTFRIWW